MLSTRDCSIKGNFRSSDSIIGVINEHNIKLVKGWNFLSVTPDTFDHTVNDFKGTCSISKAYSYNAETNSWDNALNVKLTQESVGYGMLVKTAGECVLGFESEEPITPPPLPNSS